MYLEEFLTWLKIEKNVSENTQLAYLRDVKDFLAFLQEEEQTDLIHASHDMMVHFLMKKRKQGSSASTLNRKLSSVRCYYRFLLQAGILKQNPVRNIKAPRTEQKELEYLTVAEVERVLVTPDDSHRGKRDRALMELLYATGIRVNEVIAANVEDVNLRIGFFTCPGSAGKARIIPMGRPARAAMELWIYEARPNMVHDKGETALFVNYTGSRMTRQGLWKILKEYGEKAGLEKKLTPHLLRISFAVHMVQNGADLKSLQELLGHEDLTATEVYLSVTKNRIKDVYDKAHPRA